MVATKVFVFIFFLAVSCSYCYGSPINRASIIQPVIVVPTILDQETNSDVFLNDEGTEEVIVPSVLLVLDGYLNDPENLLSKEIIDSGSRKIEKRDVIEESTKDDLETAAGTNILRPLFVYRQQLAYRQRLREATRRGNRF
ncbi:PREDICTED: uncharacterized protein LOC107067755 [Polistes dominula]|uniref:Uncharacterized protein LOC107067755 n=1 Tax=Polistes dominula TaxID=743375 RepID=A0ABM1IFQ5_POLDO|nr:PREDICTED: uncharacterized protein LOC107067755 [Polistes dominula]